MGLLLCVDFLLAGLLLALLVDLLKAVALMEVKGGAHFLDFLLRQLAVAGGADGLALVPGLLLDGGIVGKKLASAARHAFDVPLYACGFGLGLVGLAPGRVDLPLDVSDGCLGSLVRGRRLRHVGCPRFCQPGDGFRCGFFCLRRRCVAGQGGGLLLGQGIALFLKVAELGVYGCRVNSGRVRHGPLGLVDAPWDVLEALVDVCLLGAGDFLVLLHGVVLVCRAWHEKVGREFLQLRVSDDNLLIAHVPADV